ncbi:MAG: hypothetical protein WBX25_28135 [Rhodomicrobium sp.]
MSLIPTFLRVLRAGTTGIAVFAAAQGGAHADIKLPGPPSSAIEQLDGEHPAEFYKLAAKLFRHGKKDEAVFIFYLGQLRYRARLLAHRDLDPSGEPALFASLSEVVGRPINEYAFGDIPRLLSTIDAVLEYDRTHPDRFTPPSSFPEAWQQTREGLTKSKAKIERTADEIRAVRQKNGLPNR